MEWNGIEFIIDRQIDRWMDGWMDRWIDRIRQIDRIRKIDRQIDRTNRTDRQIDQIRLDSIRLYIYIQTAMQIEQNSTEENRRDRTRQTRQNRQMYCMCSCVHAQLYNYCYVPQEFSCEDVSQEMLSMSLQARGLEPQPCFFCD